MKKSRQELSEERTELAITRTKLAVVRTMFAFGGLGTRLDRTRSGIREHPSERGESCRQSNGSSALTVSSLQKGSQEANGRPYRPL